MLKADHTKHFKFLLPQKNNFVPETNRRISQTYTLLFSKENTTKTLSEEKIKTTITIKVHN